MGALSVDSTCTNVNDHHRRSSDFILDSSTSGARRPNETAINPESTPDWGADLSRNVDNATDFLQCNQSNSHIKAVSCDIKVPEYLPGCKAGAYLKVYYRTPMVFVRKQKKYT